MVELNLRRPAVAGSFYEGDSKSLNKQIEKCYLHKLGPGEIPQVNQKKQNNLVGLVSPHAGYVYSGPVAANGFYKIALGGKPDTIIILGPNHRGFGENISIMAEGKWKTPLGELEIDGEMAEEILKNSKIIKNDKKASYYPSLPLKSKSNLIAHKYLNGVLNGIYNKFNEWFYLCNRSRWHT